ncbi:MAG: ATP-binding protein, partial [Planctomycetota bacterium]
LFVTALLLVVHRMSQTSQRQLRREASQLASQLNEDSATLETIISSVPDLIFYKDTEGRYLGCNDAFAQFCGSVRGEVRGKTDYDLFRSDVAAAFRSDDFDVITRDQSKHIEEWVERPGGGQMLIETVKTPIHDAHKRLLGVVGISREITERKQYELQLQEERAKAEQGSQAKSDFLASMSHELRTPLNGVIGMTELLLNTSLDPQQERFARIAKTSADALHRLINDVLDFSKIEAGKMDLDEVDFDLHRLIEEISEVFASRAYSKGIGFVLDLSPEVPHHVCGDQARVQQILMNLIGNAVKFTSSGEVVLSVDLTRRTESHRHLRFEVSDTGIGINAEQRGRLFQSFSQGDATTTRRFGGTGLGLAISLRIAELMGGGIEVDSQEDVGSKFTVNLPLQRSTGREHERVPSHWSRLCGVRTLLVSSSTATRIAVARSLRASDVLLFSADSVDAAIAQLRESSDNGQPFELILVEQDARRLKGRTGFADRLRDSIVARDTPMVCIFPAVECASNDCEHHGNAACIAHPVTARRLLESMSRALLIQKDGDSDAADLPCTCRLQENGHSNTGAVNNDLRCGIPPTSRLTESGTDETLRTGSAAHSFGGTPPLNGSSSPTNRVGIGYRLLLAEDNEIGQLVAVNILRQFGFDCDIAATGAEAVDALLSHAYDLVLMDCQMPIMDGFEATRRARAAEQMGRMRPPEHGRCGERIPIIALTASAVRGDREACLDSGMDAYLTKPIDAAKLLDTLKHWLGLGESATDPAQGRPIEDRNLPTAAKLNRDSEEPSEPVSPDSRNTAETASSNATAGEPKETEAASQASAAPGRSVMLTIQGSPIQEPEPEEDSSDVPAGQPPVRTPPAECNIAARDGKPIDPETLLSMCRGNAVLASKIAERFATSAPDDVSRMLEFFEREDWEDLTRAAHSLKGAAGCIAADPTRAAAAALEAALQQWQQKVAGKDNGTDQNEHRNDDEIDDQALALEVLRGLISELQHEVDAAVAAVPAAVRSLDAGAERPAATNTRPSGTTSAD